MAIFGTTAIPGDSIEVRSGGTVAIGAAFATTVGLVGGMDTNNGSATPGEVVEVASSADAATQFGEDSELKKQVDLVYQNGNISTIYAVAVSETEVTAESAGGTSGSLDDAPLFDPNVNAEHDITASDTGGDDPTVEVVYDSPPATPSSADTVNVNPVTGEFEFDTTADGSYEFDYEYGDYSTAIQTLAPKVPRTLAALTESVSVANDLVTELNSAAADFEFMHGQVGGGPEVDPSSYSDTIDERRLSIVVPSRAYTDAANTNEVRTLGATAGLQSGLALGNSSTYESLGGFVDIGRTEDERYSNSELGTLIDSQVYPLKQGDRIFVVKDMTTSTDPRFERVYASEIVDEATEISHQISQQFVGELNTESNRFALGESHSTSYQEFVEDDLLDAYSVTVSEGADPDEVDVDIGLDVVDIMDTIDVTITVGDVVTNGGAQ
jgi:hypothetical protein